jgi:drug/metabolite transporter (DMT)-like permease
MTREPDNFSGSLFMALGVGLLILNDAIVKLLTESYSVWQVMALRQIAATAAIALYVHCWPGWSAVRSRDFLGQSVRGLCFVATNLFIILSLSLLPLPAVTAILFASPIFIAALSVPILGERVEWGVWAAILFGFAGMLVIMRPGGATFEWLLLLPVGAALASAVRDLVTRHLSRRDTSIAILFWSSVIVVVASLPAMALTGWQAVSVRDAGLFVAAGVLSAAAHFLVIQALRLGQAAVVSPLRYTALLWSAMLGFLFWGDLPDASTALGGFIIVASGIYMIRHGQPKGRVAAVSCPSQLTSAGGTGKDLQSKRLR